MSNRRYLVRVVFITVSLAMLVPVAAQTRIDRILEKAHQRADVEPLPVCDDATFIRRLSLDLIGRIPTSTEQSAFLAEPNRAKQIDQLLANPRFDRSWGELWTTTLVGRSEQFSPDRELFRAWLTRSIHDDQSFQRLATQMIAARGESAFDAPVTFLARHRAEPIVRVSRAFLGMRLDCARCHDHPFDRWQQDDFEKMQRFFARTAMRERNSGSVRLVHLNEHDDRQLPTFLSGARPKTTRWRDELALFVTQSRPFARNFANRVWYLLTGVGVVDPPDNFSDANPPAVPELLDYLSDVSLQYDFRLRPLIREICRSAAYQRRTAGHNATNQKYSMFVCRKLKPLTPEQFFDSATVATNRPASVDQRQEFLATVAESTPDESFGETWKYRETVQQLLEKLGTNGRTGPAMTVEEAFLTALGRDVTNTERAWCKEVVGDDVLWALVNSTEFAFNR